MADPKGFLKYARQGPAKRAISERTRDWNEIYLPLSSEQLSSQSSRCMNCGVPFCHQACPLGNLIPEWNDLVHRDQWHEAYRRLAKTNPFPEFTGKLCPAPCEDGCVLTINDSPVTIKSIEMAIIDRAFEEGWVRAGPAAHPTGKKVAIVGSGPAGLAASVELRRAGHAVTVFERSDRLGGLIRYGVPDYKMSKTLIDRRTDLLSAEGVEFRTGVEIGKDISFDSLRSEFDVVALCVGAPKARELQIPGRELGGIHFAMDYLTIQNRNCAGDFDIPEVLDARGKRVVILGGGDTGADCYGTAIRQGARGLLQFDVTPDPNSFALRAQWPESSRGKPSPVHEEGGERQWSIQTVAFEGSGGQVNALRTCQVRLEGRLTIPVPNTETLIEADMVLLAIGFEGPDARQFGFSAPRIPVSTRNQTPLPGVFAAGDAARGPSLIVWAIAEGRNVAREIDLYLMGQSSLSRSFYPTLPGSLIQVNGVRNAVASLSG